MRCCFISCFDYCNRSDQGKVNLIHIWKVLFFSFSNIKVVFCVWSTALCKMMWKHMLSWVISCRVCRFNPTFLNSFVCPHLPGLHPPPPTCLTTFCPHVNISHCCCRWCVMRGTECSLCGRSVGAVVCSSLACGVSWQACGRWRQPAACLSVCSVTPDRRWHRQIRTCRRTHTQTHSHIRCSTGHGAPPTVACPLASSVRRSPIWLRHRL